MNFVEIPLTSELPVAQSRVLDILIRLLSPFFQPTLVCLVSEFHLLPQNRLDRVNAQIILAP